MRKQNRRYRHNAPNEETTSACGTVLRTRAVSATGSIELLGVKSRLRIECNIYIIHCAMSGPPCKVEQPYVRVLHTLDLTVSKGRVFKCCWRNLLLDIMAG